MTELPMPVPMSFSGSSVPLPLEDLRQVLIGIEPGWYRTRDLYPRYVAWAESQGKTPASVKTMGEAIRRELDVERGVTHGNVSRWYITEELTKA